MRSCEHLHIKQIDGVFCASGKQNGLSNITGNVPSGAFGAALGRNHGNFAGLLTK